MELLEAARRVRNRVFRTCRFRDIVAVVRNAMELLRRRRRAAR